MPDVRVNYVAAGLAGCLAEPENTFAAIDSTISPLLLAPAVHSTPCLSSLPAIDRTGGQSGVASVSSRLFCLVSCNRPSSVSILASKPSVDDDRVNSMLVLAPVDH